MSVATRSTYVGDALPSTPKEETYYYWSTAASLKKSRKRKAAVPDLDHQLLTRRLSLKECLSVDIIHVDGVGGTTWFHRQRVPLPVVDWKVHGDRACLALLYLDVATKEVYLVARISEDDGSETVQRYMLDQGIWLRLQGQLTDLARHGHKTRQLDWSAPPRKSTRSKV